MLNVNKKLYHYVCAKFKESHEVAALVETVEINIDMYVRKSAEISSKIFETLIRMQKQHESSGDYPYETKLKIK